jgi:arylformamidase
MNHLSEQTIIDISVPLHSGMPVWPGSSEFRLTQVESLEKGDSANVSKLECEVHAGTHIDAPRHFLPEGVTTEALPLGILMGRAFVAFFPDAGAIMAEHLAGLEVPLDLERLLLRTRNSELWREGVNEFRTDYAALTPDAARWIVERGIKLVGIDYLSIERYGEGSTVHQSLLKSNVVILEGLNLSDVEPGIYNLICLPLMLVGAEGAPARAVLVRSNEYGA